VKAIFSHPLSPNRIYTERYVTRKTRFLTLSRSE
jgi:hypothetical protein